MTKLYVGNLSYGMTDESLLQLFSERGYKAVSARIITDRETGRSRGFGFVELGPGDDATPRIRRWRCPSWWWTGILWRTGWAWWRRPPELLVAPLVHDFGLHVSR